MINYALWKVGDIVAADYRKAEILKKYNIDFCCGGKTLLKDACKSIGIDYQQVLNSFSDTEHTELLPSQNFAYWDLSFLCDYIYSTHHAYIYQAKNYLLDYASKVEINHAENHPNLVKLREVVCQLFDELEAHMGKEEQILFPSIKKLSAIYQNKDTDWSQIDFLRNIGKPIQVMENEHDEAGTYIKQIAELTHDFQTPDDACLTYKVFYLKLKEFIDDLMMHIHLENNILFPRAIKLAAKFDRA